MLVATNLLSELTTNLDYIQKSSPLPFLKYPISITKNPTTGSILLKANEQYCNSHWKIHFVSGLIMSTLCICKILTHQNHSLVYNVFGYCNIHLALGLCYHQYFYSRNTQTLCNIYNQFISFEKHYINLENLSQKIYYNPKNNNVRIAKSFIKYFRMNFLQLTVFLPVCALIFPKAPWSLLPDFITEWEFHLSGSGNSIFIWISTILFRLVNALYSYYMWRLGTVAADLDSTFWLTISHYSIFSIGEEIER